MKPLIFIGSSVEGLGLAEAMQESLAYVADSLLWNQGVFDLSRGTLTSLIEQARRCDFALFILSPDDITNLRKKQYSTARDNVLLELGLFAGFLGQERVFFLTPNDDSFHLPTDLLGITAASYTPGSHDGNLVASVGAAASSVKRAIERLRSPTAEQINLNGKWSGIWQFSRNSYPAENPFEATILQIGDKIRTNFVSNGERYPVTGKISRGHFITGIWGNPDAGASYFGPYQLVISPNGKSLTGMWSGFGSNMEVDSGRFIWNRSAEA